MRDKIMRRYDQELLGAPLWCTTQQEEGLWIQGVNTMVPQRWIFVCASELALDESLSHWHIGLYTTEEEVQVQVPASMIGATGELDYISAHIHLREPSKSEDKAECKATDSRVMGLAAPLYHRGGTSVESSIPCSQGGRALVVKGAEEECSTKEQSRQYAVLYLFYSEELATKVIEKMVQSQRRPDLSKTYSKLG
ncbi:hypothetical protein B296_00005990 [Ensete ventricosum]|uniref:Uncharacterized protein n=1 Tax=Ensete ventricosum TaxID=4639 RepID=A0A426X0A3_ENSVE|nr:hypothetical protein B296_00005990 [Ensete ventricosum]